MASTMTQGRSSLSSFASMFNRANIHSGASPCRGSKFCTMIDFPSSIDGSVFEGRQRIGPHHVVRFPMVRLTQHVARTKRAASWMRFGRDDILSKLFCIFQYFSLCQNFHYSHFWSPTCPLKWHDHLVLLRKAHPSAGWWIPTFQMLPIVVHADRREFADMLLVHRG